MNPTGPVLAQRHVRWILVAVLALQLVMLTSQVRDPSGRTRLEVLSVRLVAPAARAVAGTLGLIQRVPRALALRRSLQEENRRLRDEVRQLREEKIRNFGLERELALLAESVQYARHTPAGLRAADVVYVDYLSSLRTLLLHMDSEGVEVNQPVVAAAGLVGRVVLRSGPYVKVQLITDRSASVGAMIERTRRQGVARGGEDGYLDLEFVPRREDVRVGDRVLTAGIDGVFPRGVPVGVVTAVETGTDRFHRIRLSPAVDFGVLGQVFVMERAQIPDELKGGLDDDGP